MVNLEAILPELTYTPKTYGLEGFSFRGFEIDKIFSAGSSITNPADFPTSTWQLLKFHIRRSMLSAILNIIALKDDDPIQRANSTIVDLILKLLDFLASFTVFLGTISSFLQAVLGWLNGITDYALQLVDWLRPVIPVDLIKKIWDWLESLIPDPALALLTPVSDTWKSFRKGELLGPKKKVEIETLVLNKNNILGSQSAHTKNFAVMINSKAFVAPPPPFMPSEEQQESMDPEDVEAIKRDIKLHEETESEFFQEETDRVVEEAASVIYWSHLLKLQMVTLYEKQGLLAKNSAKVIEATKKKFIHSGIRMPNMSMSFPSEEAIYDIVSQSSDDKTLEGIHTKVMSITKRKVAILPDMLIKDSHKRFEHTRPPSAWGDGPQNIEMKVVVLERRNGRRLTMKALRRVCLLIEQGRMSKINAEQGVLVYLEQYDIKPIDMVVCAGMSATVNGLPPLCVRNALLCYDYNKEHAITSELMVRAVQKYNDIVKLEIANASEPGYVDLK